MVIAFKKRSENTEDLVFEGLHVYVISNLRDMKRYEHGVKQGVAGALRTYANLIPCNYKMTLSSRIPTPKFLNSHSSNIEATNVVALPLSLPKSQTVQ